MAGYMDKDDGGGVGDGDGGECILAADLELNVSVFKVMHQGFDAAINVSTVAAD